jgi:hypothetical protein
MGETNLTEQSCNGQPVLFFMERGEALVLVVGAGVLIFWRYLFAGEGLFAGDTAYVFYPWRATVAREAGVGELELWNPHIFGGAPAVADPQVQLFYPFNVLLLLLGPARGTAVLLALHFIGLAVITYSFGRCVLRVRPWAAAIAGMAYGYGGSEVRSRR